MKTQNKNHIKLYICPKCKSTNVYHPFKLRNFFGVIPKWECGDCGFNSSLFPILIIDKNKLKKKIKQKWQKKK